MELTPEQKLQLAELKARAKELGVKVRAGFMDDWQENCIILAVGIAIGFAVAAVVL